MKNAKKAIILMMSILTVSFSFVSNVPNVSAHNLSDTENIEVEIQPTAIGTFLSVTVIVETVVVGYILVEVIDGIVAGVTNTDGLSDFVKQQVQSLIGRPYTSTFYGGGGGAGGGR